MFQTPDGKMLRSLVEARRWMEQGAMGQSGDGEGDELNAMGPVEVSASGSSSVPVLAVTGGDGSSSALVPARPASELVLATSDGSSFMHVLETTALAAAEEASATLPNPFLACVPLDEHGRLAPSLSCEHGCTRRRELGAFATREEAARASHHFVAEYSAEFERLCAALVADMYIYVSRSLGLGNEAATRTRSTLVGEAVDFYWPMDDTWHAATCVEHVDRLTYKFEWRDDGTPEEVNLGTPMFAWRRHHTADEDEDEANQDEANHTRAARGVRLADLTPNDDAEAIAAEECLTLERGITADGYAGAGGSNGNGEGTATPALLQALRVSDGDAAGDAAGDVRSSGDAAGEVGSNDKAASGAAESVAARGDGSSGHGGGHGGGAADGNGAGDADGANAAHDEAGGASVALVGPVSGMSSAEGAAAAAGSLLESRGTERQVSEGAGALGSATLCGLLHVRVLSRSQAIGQQLADQKAMAKKAATRRAIAAHRKRQADREAAREAAAKEAELKAQERRANPHLAKVAAEEAKLEAATSAKGQDKGAVQAAEQAAEHALELAAAKSKKAVAVFDATRKRAADAQKKARAKGVQQMADTVRGVILRAMLCGIEQRLDIVEYAGSRVGSRK